jgi:hypothetical protein
MRQVDDRPSGGVVSNSKACTGFRTPSSVKYGHPASGCAARYVGCRRLVTIIQPVCGWCGKPQGSQSNRIESTDRAAAYRERHRCQEMTIMSMMAAAAVGITEITALITTITAAFSAATRADRAAEAAQNPRAAARRARRLALRARGISRQASWVGPEYLPALTHAQLLRMRGMR